MAARAFALSMALVACSSTEVAPPPGTTPPPDAGPAPEEPGLLPWTCQPGEVLAADGECEPAGIPPDGCGAGFAHDGVDGCNPILPDSPCGPGLLAIPGETTCRPVAPCGTGKWGDIVVDASTMHVDASHIGTSDGSAANPFTTIAAAITAADPGATIAIAAGSYAEALSLFKPVVLWGVCPDQVEITAPAGSTPIEINPAADGAVVRSLAVTGDYGIGVIGAKDVLIDRVWAHDTTMGEAIGASNSGATLGHVTIQGSLVENTKGTAVLSWGAHLVVSESVVRDADVDATGGYGSGIQASSGDLEEVASLRLERSLVERVHAGGVMIWSAAAEIVDSVVRDVDLVPTPINGAPCVYALTADRLAPPDVQITGSVLERCTMVGVLGFDGQMTIDRTMVRDIEPLSVAEGIFLGNGDIACSLTHSVVAGTTGLGVVFRGSTCDMAGLVVRDVAKFGNGLVLNAGIAVQQAGQPIGPEATIRGCKIEDVSYRGIVSWGAKVDVETTLIARVPGVEGYTAAGIIAEANEDASSGPYVPSSCTVRDSSIEQVNGWGMAVAESDAQIHSTRFADLTDPSESWLSTGISVVSPNVEMPASAVITHTVVERAQGVGLVLSGRASATLDWSIVRETTPDPTIGLGDCVSSMTLSDFGRTQLTITNSVLEAAARAAVSNFGGDVAISSTRFECNPIDLDGEQFHLANLEGDASPVPSEYAFDDLGGNTCGCGDESWPCQIKTENLEPPIPPGASP